MTSYYFVLFCFEIDRLADLLADLLAADRLAG